MRPLNGASEEDVQAKLAEFDQQVLPVKDKYFKDFEFEIEGMNFKFYFKIKILCNNG